MIQCQICNREFKNENNIKIHIGKSHGKNKTVAWNKGLTSKTSDIVKRCAESYSKNHSPIDVEFSGICKKCGVEFSYFAHPSSFQKACCSIKCARSIAGLSTAKSKNRDENKIKVKLKSFDMTIKFWCCICEKPLTTKRKFCDDHRREALSNAGKISAERQSLTRRSLNEMHFAELCQTRFQSVRTNERCFNGWDADVIIDDIKVAVLWNGPWHQKKITKKHSVKQVQNRDKIKIAEIIKCGYIPYVIDDPSKQNVNFVKNEFDKFIISIAGIVQRLHSGFIPHPVNSVG